jgi:transposase
MPAPKLTPEIQQTITTAIAQGANATQAARTAGIGRSTLYTWAQQGARPGAEKNRRAISEALARARAEKSRRAVTRETIADDRGRTVGTRITRRLRNGVTEVTEDYQRPDRRALRRQLRQAHRDDPLEALFGVTA